MSKNYKLTDIFQESDSSEDEIMDIISQKSLRVKIYQLEEDLKKEKDENYSLRRTAVRCEGELRRLKLDNRHLKNKLAKATKENTELRENYINKKIQHRKDILPAPGETLTMRPDTELPRTSGIKSIGHGWKVDFNPLEQAALKVENAKLRSVIEASDEKSHKYKTQAMRMQRTANSIWRKYKELEEDQISLLKNIMKRIDQGHLLYYRGIVVDMAQEPLKRDCADMLNDLSNLTYENAFMRLELQSLKREIYAGLYEPRQSTRDKERRASDRIVTEDLSNPSMKTLVGSSSTTSRSHGIPIAHTVATPKGHYAFKTHRESSLESLREATLVATKDSSNMKRYHSLPCLPHRIPDRDGSNEKSPEERIGADLPEV